MKKNTIYFVVFQYKIGQIICDICMFDYQKFTIKSNKNTNLNNHNPFTNLLFNNNMSVLWVFWQNKINTTTKTFLQKSQCLLQNNLFELTYQYVKMFYGVYWRFANIFNQFNDFR